MIIIYNLAEDILIMIFKAKSSLQNQEDVITYSTKITDKRIFPKAYDECQAVLENKFQDDPFLCGKFILAWLIIIISLIIIGLRTVGVGLGTEPLRLLRRNIGGAVTYQTCLKNWHSFYMILLTRG